jgi:hypothetical protein
MTEPDGRPAPKPFDPTLLSMIVLYAVVLGMFVAIWVFRREWPRSWTPFIFVGGILAVLIGGWRADRSRKQPPASGAGSASRRARDLSD